ncbi:MAG TPA: hypothetical protein VK902_02805 [Rubrobacter sp.]|jgi:hypothetical protein|nr:hypothetical protein [Rubrobacter sp.]
MIDSADAAKMDASSRPPVTPYGVDLFLEGRIEFLDEPVDDS